MKKYTYIVMLCCCAIGSCSDNEDTAKEAQLEESQTDSKAALKHFKESIDQSNETKRLQEDADRKKQEMLKKALE